MSQNPCSRLVNFGQNRRDLQFLEFLYFHMLYKVSGKVPCVKKFSISNLTKKNAPNFQNGVLWFLFGGTENSRFAPVCAGPFSKFLYKENYDFVLQN